MELIRGLHNLRAEHRGCAITIGNFDGVHLGHQAVIAHLAEKARSLRVPAVVMLFEPQPREYFRPDLAPARLMRLTEKLSALAAQPVDRVLCLRFDAKFAPLEPQAFIDQILRRKLDARYVVVGDDFRFGNNRAGDIDMLRQAGKAQGFKVESAPTFQIGGERVSSTRVRAALAAGDMQAAERLLGRPYRMCGRVAHGNKIGRQIGVPTANVRLHRRRVPIEGIFVVEMTAAGEVLPAVASVGTRPTVGGSEPLLEVHVFDFDRDLYGAHVAVDFLHRLRGERHFPSLEEMRAHIEQDIVAAKEYFKNHSSTRQAAANGLRP